MSEQSQNLSLISNLFEFLGSNTPEDIEYRELNARLDVIEDTLSKPLKLRIERGPDGLIAGAIAEYED